MLKPMEHGMHGKYLNREMFTSPCVIISLPGRRSSRINHLGTVNVEHKVLSHLSPPFSIKFFPVSCWLWSPSSSEIPEQIVSVCFTSLLPWRGDEERKEHFNNLQPLSLTLELGQSLVKGTGELWTAELHCFKLGERAHGAVCGFSNFPSIKFDLFSRILNQY